MPPQFYTITEVFTEKKKKLGTKIGKEKFQFQTNMK